MAPTLTYRYVVGTALLAGVDPSCTNVDKSVAAANGDTIVVEGEGTFSARGGQNSASGGGTFLHKRADGSVVASGTWTATQLLSFKSYGPGTPQGAPPKWEGGLALIRVHLSPGFDAVLQIDCVLGKPPAGAKEGIRFAVQDALNFNREVSGCTLFIRES